ncbi:MAG: hypothetical protein ACE5JL_19575 [Dehalococcoidia bacterium]
MVNAVVCVETCPRSLATDCIRRIDEEDCFLVISVLTNSKDAISFDEVDTVAYS